uniref:Uncharacterized protein n=1 Tax=Panagrolaimus sp. JU765 TaxID=591449 RepID=A0AC34Q5D3_9BILA
MADANESNVDVSTIPVENGHVADESAASSSKPRRTQFTPQSQPIINEAHRLLNMKPTGTPTIDVKTYNSETEGNELSRSSSTANAFNSVRPSNPYKFLHTSSSVNRIGFDDVITDSIASRKPAWKEMQESIKDSYYRPKRLVERQEDEREFAESLYDRPHRSRRSTSPFAYLPRSSSHVTLSSQGPYAAPAVENSQGIESTISATESRYDRLVNDMEARLLKTTYGLPSRYRTTTKEFRRAPEPASGSLTEAYLDEAESLMMPRPYYSRPNRRDPDYFDFDLQHSVDLYRRPEGRYIPRGPSYFDNKILGDYKTKGDAPLSGHMFTKTETDYRTTGTSLLSAALRTPSFWEHRFSNIGGQIRESNPISLASLERNRPVPNKFTEYRDPDFESQEYDDLSD